MRLRTQFSPWRVGVTGASQGLSVSGAEMCEAIGERLGAEANVKLVHHGLKNRNRTKADDRAADWHFVAGAKRMLRGDTEARIETLFSEDGLQPTPTPRPGGGGGAAVPDQEPVMFVEGELRRTRARTFQARRFAFVSSLDALIGLGGGYGTQQQLVLASAIEIPVLPVPCFGGRSKAFWDENRKEISSALRIDDATAERWQATPQTRDEILSLSAEMVDRLVHCLPKRAFVIMPYSREFDTLFDLVVVPAVAASGDEVRRLDRLDTPGAVTQQIVEGIRTSDYCIVVLDGFRPNVLYEMGYAQALGKPVILLLHAGESAVGHDVPFDIATLQRIEYDRLDQSTVDRLSVAVDKVVPRRFSRQA